MRTKFFSQLTDLQKAKVQQRINEAYKRTIDTITFLKYQSNDDKKATIFLDSCDIYHRSVSNIVHRISFTDNLKAMFTLSGNTQYLSNKL